MSHMPDVNVIHQVRWFILRFPQMLAAVSRYAWKCEGRGPIDFIAMYTPGFCDMIRRSWFDTNHMTYGFAVRKRLQK